MSWIDEPVVVVTGASGGIGQAVSRWVSERGGVVFQLDRLPPQHPIGSFVEVDVLDADSVEAAVERVRSEAGRIDGLVAAAGIAESPTPAEAMAVSTWDRTIGVNLRGAWLTCQSVGKVMLAQGSGRIVTIASMSGNHIVNTPQQQVAYNVSKAGVVAMTKSLAYEWAGRGVRVNAVSPGYVDTPLLGDKVEMHAQWRNSIPLGRFSTPDEVAGTVWFLLSDEAAYFVGGELLMDGGYSLA